MKFLVPIETSTESVPGVAKCFGIFVPVISTLYLSTNPGGTFVPVISTLYLSTCLHWKVPAYLSTLEGTCPYWRVPLLGRSTLEGTCPHWRVPLLRPIKCHDIFSVPRFELEVQFKTGGQRFCLHNQIRVPRKCLFKCLVNIPVP